MFSSNVSISRSRPLPNPAIATFSRLHLNCLSKVLRLPINRRDIMRKTAWTTASCNLLASFAAGQKTSEENMQKSKSQSDAAGLPLVTSPGTRKGEMLYRPLGRTGEQVSAIGMGGFHIGHIQDEPESIKLIRTAIDRGITFMDNSWDYNDGVSEVRMGKALRDGYRQKVFLMTKFDGRTKDSAARQIDES